MLSQKLCEIPLFRCESNIKSYTEANILLYQHKPFRFFITITWHLQSSLGNSFAGTPNIPRDNHAFPSKLRYAVNCDLSARMHFLLPSSYESEGSKTREEEHTEKSKRWRVGRAALDDWISLSLSFSGYHEIVRCQNFLIRRSGTAEQSAGTFSESEWKRREGRKRDFIESRGIAFQPRKREYRDSDEPPPRPSVPIRVESGATNSRLTSVPCFFSFLFFILVSNSSQINAW